MFDLDIKLPIKIIWYQIAQKLIDLVKEDYLGALIRNPEFDYTRKYFRNIQSYLS